MKVRSGFRNGTLTALAFGIAATAIGLANPANSQDSNRRIIGPPREDEVARFYDSISASPTLPVDVSDPAVIAMRIPKPGPDLDGCCRVASDPCADPEIAALCEISGAETIRKIRNYSWGRKALNYNGPLRPVSPARAADPGSPDISVQLALFEEGVRRQSEKKAGANGYSDEADQQSDALWASLSPSSDKKLIRSYAGCKNDEKSLSFGFASLFPRHRLKTCHAHISVRVSLWIFAIEGAGGITQSSFTRKVIGWIPNGASNIDAITKLGGSVFQNPQTNKWITTSGGVKVAINQPPMALSGQGTATELGTNFGLTLP